jgi:hypothetical protein
MVDEEDEEEDDGRQKIELREGSISLDQVSVSFFPFSMDIYHRLLIR